MNSGMESQNKQSSSKKGSSSNVHHDQRNCDNGKSSDGNNNNNNSNNVSNSNSNNYNDNSNTNKKRGAAARGEESSLSSLGSLAEVNTVTSQFLEDHTSSRRPNPPTGSSSSLHTTHYSNDQSIRSSRDFKTENRTCPHCKKVFTNSWAVPKHVSVRS